jgi:class 3 adenylate cyclase/tetratricopeptide (TPR) repeat protein
MLTCPTCGQENPDGFVFCGKCGAALTPVGGREVRKTVTVLFADVTGSTALGEQLDPESFRRVMARYFELARGCLERHGGTVEKFIGDAVMAVFGVPVVHEDDALRAVRAAAELRDTLATLNDQLEREYGVSLLLRTGVNTGEVVTGTEERLATGDAVNVAARLEQAAEPGEILLGEQTHLLARDAIEVEPVAPLPLKGKTEDVPAYRLVRVVEGAPAFDRRLDSPLVGRSAELARLRKSFKDAVSSRRCRLVTLLGPPGIGKSRLSREVEAVLADEATVLSGSCLPYGEGITYWPLVEIFREARAEEELSSALAAGGPEEISLSVRKAFERRSRERPLALVVEDIHWAEPTLLDLLEHLVDWTRDAPLLLLCQARPELLDERPTWGGQAEAETIRLEPLSQAESDELIEGLVPGAELEDEIRTRIRETAEGNPLFVEQLLAVLSEQGEAESLPPTIHALLAARLDGLPEEERDVLERASVVGAEFEWEALAALASDRNRPPGARLATLVRKDLIQPHEAIEDSFRFRHRLIRDAAYERIPKELRSELHERFAEWLEGRGEELDEIVGYHLEQAYRSLEALGPVNERARLLGGRAAEQLAASARRVRGRGDTKAAVSLFERAVALLPPDDRRRVELLPAFGRALREAGQIERAQSVFVEAVELGRTTGQRAAAADAAVALTDLRFHRPTLTGVSREDVLRELETAIPVFEELGDRAGLARAVGLRGRLLFWKGDSTAALEHLERAAALAAEAGDRAEEADSLRYVVTALHRGPLPVDEALVRLEQMGALGEANFRFRISLLGTRAMLEAMRGRFEVAHDLVSQAGALAEELGAEAIIEGQVAPTTGAIFLLAGDAVAAEQDLRAACEGLERSGELGYLSSVAPQLIDALVAQGRDEEAFALSERWRADRLTVPEDVDAQVGWRRVRAKLLARRGEVEEAERLGREASAMASGTDFSYLRANAFADLADVLRLAGKPDEAGAVLAEAIRLCEEKGNTVTGAALAAGASVSVP